MNNALGYLSREGSDFKAERQDGEWILTMAVDRGLDLRATGASLITAMNRLSASLSVLKRSMADADGIGLNLGGAKSVSSQEVPGDEKGMSADGVAGYFD